MENDGAGVFVHIQLDTDDACEVKGGEVWVDGQVVVDGGDGCGESHAVPGEWLTVGGDGDIFCIWDLSS